MARREERATHRAQSSLTRTSAPRSGATTPPAQRDRPFKVLREAVASAGERWSSGSSGRLRYRRARRAGAGADQAARGPRGVAAAPQPAGERGPAGAGAVGRGGTGRRDPDGAGLRLAVAQRARRSRGDRDHAGRLPAAGAPGRARRRALCAWRGGRAARAGGRRERARGELLRERSSCGVGRRWPSWSSSRSRRWRSRSWRSSGWRRWRRAWRPISRAAGTPRWSVSSSGLLAEHPTRERSRPQLMLALYRSGRQAEALEVYRDARRVLVERRRRRARARAAAPARGVLDQDASLELPTPAAKGSRRLGADAARGPGAKRRRGRLRAGAARCRGPRTGRSGARARVARSRSGYGPGRCGC